MTMPTLEILDLSRNEITSELPDLFGQGMSNIRSLSLASNDLSGEISPSIGAMKKIEVFDICHNVRIVNHWPKGIVWADSQYLAILGTSLTSDPIPGDAEKPSEIPRLCLDVPLCYRFMWNTHPDFTLATAEDFAANTLVQETLKLALENA